MIVKLQSSSIKGSVHVPPSKSMTQRAYALSLLHKGETILKNAGVSDDELAARSIIEHFGARIVQSRDHTLVINAEFGKTFPDSINCGESGLCFRMFTPIAALGDHPITITGTGSLLDRPMDLFGTYLPQLGVSFKSNSGKPPVQVRGPLIPQHLVMDGSLSSQFLTGMLMAFAKAARSSLSIKVENLTSKPYIDLTLSMMNLFGYAVRHEEYEVFTIDPTPNRIATVTCNIEGDWSGAAFLLVAAAITGEVEVTGLNPASNQADIAILEALKTAGVHLTIESNVIRVKRSGLEAFNFDAGNCPDLFPPLVALAAYCKGKSVIKGVKRLAHKESNRGIALQKEFSKMGVDIIIDGNLMVVEGKEKPDAGNFDSHHDHRIAMAVAVAALGIEGECTITNAEATRKSYPGFFEDLQAVGANCSIIS